MFPFILLLSFYFFGLMSRVFAYGPGFNPRSGHITYSKNGTWYRLA